MWNRKRTLYPEKILKTKHISSNSAFIA